MGNKMKKWRSFIMSDFQSSKQKRYKKLSQLSSKLNYNILLVVIIKVNHRHQSSQYKYKLKFDQTSLNSQVLSLTFSEISV